MRFVGKTTTEYYNFDRTLKAYPDCDWYMLLSGRGVGKTIGVCMWALRNYKATGERFLYLRRWPRDLGSGNIRSLFTDVNLVKLVRKLWGGQYDCVVHYAGAFYLAVTDPNTGKVSKGEIIGFSANLYESESMKSKVFENCTSVIFDECITRGRYIDNEFVLLCNAASSALRTRKGRRVIMLGNTVSKYCPHYAEMGLTHVQDLKPGDIQLYDYADGARHIYLEMCPTKVNEKGDTDTFFAFDNPRLRMISTGEWEMAVYPHWTYGKLSDPVFSFFVDHPTQMLQGDVYVTKHGASVCIIHRKTTELQHPNQDLIFSALPDPRPNWVRDFRQPYFDVHKRLLSMYNHGMFYYQDNEVGEMFASYIGAIN